jgi:ribosome-binding protein aMBF1 (putative translation factor)
MGFKLMRKRPTTAKANTDAKSSAPKIPAEPRKPTGRPRKPRPATTEGDLGARIEAERKSRGWTARQLAEVAGVGLGTVCGMEGGKSSPALGTVARIAAAFGLKPSELLDGCREW